MLTWQEVIEASRLMQDYGELRPGFVDHDSANLAGPSAYPYTHGASSPSEAHEPEEDMEARHFSFEYDGATGKAIFRVD